MSTKSKSAPLYAHLQRPSYRLRNPDRTLNEREYELLKLTVEDFYLVTSEITDDLKMVASEIRGRSTILRRLLCHGDLFNAGSLYPPKDRLRIRARMLDFEPAHPTILISCGNYPWKDDRLRGLAAEFAIQGIAPLRREAAWSYREEADITLSEYLDGLAIAVLGTRIRRREVIKYVADKKAAHVSDNRSSDSEKALDRVWSQLAISIQSSDGQTARLNVAYLEILSVMKALSESDSIKGYISELSNWLATAEVCFENVARIMKFEASIDAIAKIDRP